MENILVTLSMVVRFVYLLVFYFSEKFRQTTGSPALAVAGPHNIFCWMAFWARYVLFFACYLGQVGVGQLPSLFCLKSGPARSWPNHCFLLAFSLGQVGVVPLFYLAFLY